MKTSHPEPLKVFITVKRRNKIKYLTWNSIRLKFVKKTSMLNSEALDIWSATAQVAPDLLKALAILSDTTVRRFAVDREDLKPYWKPEKRPHFSKWLIILLFTSFLKTLLSTDVEITKPDHKLTKTFYFIKLYVLAELWMFFYFVWCFFAATCHFQP